MIQQLRRKFPYCFVVTILIIIILLYIAFVKLLILDLNIWSTAGAIIFLIIYHVILILLLWSLFQSMRKDPGKVPYRWGFTMNNQNMKYCLVCHVFKPERTHHCSACNRCVLNMDHHWSPWINTCIGFYNRKAFILMLIYTSLATILNVIAFLLSIYGIIKQLSEHHQAGFIVRLAFISMAFIFNCIIMVTIVLFLKFHLQLIFQNYTTLQTLQLKRQGKQFSTVKSAFNIGNYYNWAQVFGRNSITWPIPIFLTNQGPSGDGVIWPKLDN